MTTKPLGDVALGEVRRWANTCDDEGGRLYALPLADAYEALRAEIEQWKEAHHAQLAAYERCNASMLELRVERDHLRAQMETVREALQ